MSNKPEQEQADDTPHRNVAVFKHHILQLFRGERGGHTALWVYHNGRRGGHQPTGSKLWTDFLAAKGNDDEDGYYVLDEERKLIKWNLKNGKLQEQFGESDSLIDLGSGGAEAVIGKAMPIFQAIPAGIYVPVDLSYGLLEIATAEARSFLDRLPPGHKKRGAKVEPVNANFFTGKTPACTEVILPGKRRTGLLLGSTITNMPMRLGDEFPRERIIRRINGVSEWLTRGTNKRCTLTFGYDSNHDLESAAAAYQHETWSQLIVGLMFDVQNVLKPKGYFNPVGWEHKTIIDKKNHVLHQCVVATEDQNFFIGDDENAEEFKIKKGDTFVVKNNFKYPFDLFGDMVREAGHTPLEAIRHQSERMVLQTVELNAA